MRGRLAARNLFKNERTLLYARIYRYSTRLRYFLALCRLREIENRVLAVVFAQREYLQRNISRASHQFLEKDISPFHGHETASIVAVIHRHHVSLA